MIYMGVDLSTTSSGIGIFDDDKLIHYECIKPKSKNWEERVGVMFVELDRILKSYPIEHIFVEEIPMKDGKPTLIKLSAIRGAFISACYINNIPFTPRKVNEWRQDCGFYGDGVKGLKREEMKKKAIEEVKNLFDIDVNDDIAESCLIAYRTRYPKEEIKGFGRKSKMK